MTALCGEKLTCNNLAITLSESRIPTRARAQAVSNAHTFLAETQLQIKRCAILLIEPREKLAFDLDSLANGGDGIDASIDLFALAPHLPSEVIVSSAEVEILNSVIATRWSDYSELSAKFEPQLLSRLLDKGLLIGDSDSNEEHRRKDGLIRNGHWHPHSAVSHFFGRWGSISSQEATENANLCSMSELIERLGMPPCHQHELVSKGERVQLPATRHTAIDDLLGRRVTCRNFDETREVEELTFSHLMKRVFGAQAAYEIHPGNIVIKRTSPSGGGLHPTEPYLLIQRVEGIAPGLYHYHAVDHALEPLSLQGGDLISLARVMVTQQAYFSNAAVLIVLASRFGRMFWKYRNHSKAYRVSVLDVGHLSQTLYISATEFGLGAFITAAINEVDIEQAFGLDPLVESPLAVVGFGHRGPECETFEFDPNRKVWPNGVEQPK